MIFRPPIFAGLSLLLAAASLELAAQATVPTPPDAPNPSTGAPPRDSWAAESRPVPVNQTPSQVAIFDEGDILRSGARTLGEFLLAELPAQVQSQGGPGLPAQIYLGGSRPQDTLVTMDGMPLMDPGRLGQDLNEVSLLGVTRIEVITGSPGSGPSGQGGTIALFTGKPTHAGVSGDLGGLGGNQGQGQGTATPGYAWEGGYLRGGNLSAREDQALPTDRPYRQVANFLTLGQTWGSVVWRVAWRSTSFGIPDPYQEVTDTLRIYNPARDSHQRSDTGQVRLDWDLGPGLSLEASLGLSRFRHDQPNAGSPLPTRFEGRQTRFQSALNLGTGPRSGLSLRLEGADTRQDGDVDPAILGAVKGSQIALGLEWHFEPAPGLRLLGQARGTRDRQSLIQGNLETEVLRGTGHTLRLGVNQELGDGFRVYAAGGSGRTAPALIEQLRNSQVPGAAPLRMERTTFLQAGLGWGRGDWYGRLESQQQTGRDLIGATPGGPYVNGDRVRVQGTDAAFGWRQAQRRGLEAFVRAQEARDLNAPDGQQYRTAASQRRPFSAQGLKGFLGWGRVRVDLHYTLQGHQYSSFGEGAAPAATNGLPPLIIRATHVVYRDLGLAATLAAGRHWHFILRGEHLLQPKTTADQWVADLREGQNDAYLIDGYPAGPPTYSLEARYRF